jgi:hypothetical protein
VQPVDDQFADAQTLCGLCCAYIQPAGMLQQPIHLLLLRRLPLPPADAAADAPCRLWVERMRMLYEIVGAGVPVIMSDLDAIWFKDALSDIEVRPG